jgi:hydrogenase maturation protein HypF
MAITEPVTIDEQATRLRLDMTGAVQGVGFRPFVHRLAMAERLGGFVRNTGDGVSIEVEGAPLAVARFIARLEREMPPRAVVFRREKASLRPRGERDFIVAPSTLAGDGASVVMADLATCADCHAEIFDPIDRRYQYPFTSCVNCGPRYSIIEAQPYDRARTTMRHFPLCAACLAEYTDPTSRRFHAEPIACADCGPSLALRNDAGGVTDTGHIALLAAVDALRRGMIVALKGLGGFQLLVDAADDAAVARLRARKQRPRKPFALMVPSLDATLGLAHVGEVERRLLASPEAPIVLLRVRSYHPTVSPVVAPDNPRLGVMLPYTPLHHLLMAEFAAPLVATSGNLGDEPIVTDETEAASRLRGIADCFLVHDRPIQRAIDDSVIRVIAGQPVILRRARGYAPMPIARAGVTEKVLALGGQQKSSVAVGGSGQIFAGPHIGDLADARTRDSFARMAQELPALHGIQPGVVACDTHPEYHSSHAAADGGLPVTRVPHHLAHILSCMADNGLEGPVLGVAWDGTGDGGDGTIWGGEFLTVDDKKYRRAAHLLPFRLAGGEAAIREPRRSALGMLHAMHGDDAMKLAEPTLFAAFTAKQRDTLATMLRTGVNAPLTSSVGRLFDAVSAILGLCQVNSFEGEAAMAVEFAACRAHAAEPMPAIAVRDDGGKLVLDWRDMLSVMLRERRRGVAPEPLAAALHEKLAASIVEVARRVGRRRVVLTGGCFQNARLTEQTVDQLCAAGFAPYFHHRVPPNDGGLAVGQVVFAAQPLVEEKP